MDYVIVGAGPAGVIAAETLARADKAATITLVGDEPEPPYSRMAIPYYLTGKIGEEGTYLRKRESYYDELGIRYLHGRAEKVSPGEGRLALAGAEALAFDRLLVATGAHAIDPPIPGLDADGVHHCWTLEDARRIARLAESGADVVLIGAGFIACIILGSFVERGVNLTVIEMEDRMLPRMMNATGGALIERWCADKGVNVLTATRVEAVERGADGALKVVTDRGGAVNAALVVVAAGVAPNVGFLEGSGVKVENGVVVDDRLQSSVETIFAAGDVAQGPDFSGGWMVHAIQPTAAEHGRIAALNMAGGDARYKGSLIMNVLDTAGLVSSSFGHWQGADDGDVAERLDEDGFKYIRLAFAGDRLIGALCLGRTDHIGTLRGLIQSRLRLGGWKAKLMEDPHRIAEAYVACSQGAG